MMTPGPVSASRAAFAFDVRHQVALLLGSLAMIRVRYGTDLVLDDRLRAAAHQATELADMVRVVAAGGGTAE